MADPKQNIDVADLPMLREMFETLNRGRHLNRHHDRTLWADLEQHREQYETLFSALGYELRTDIRGFAWFHAPDATANVTQNSRRLALFFLILFEHQADQGHYLGTFDSWVIDRQLLELLADKNRDLLEAEGLLDAENLTNVLGRGVSYGIVAEEPNGWKMLPAACRYLDHFEALASASRAREASDSELLAQEGTL